MSKVSKKQDVETNDFIVHVGHRDIVITKFEKHQARAHEALGIFHVDSAKIEVSTELQPFDQIETLIHEILHSIWHDRSLKEKGVTEEEAIDNLGKGLTAFIKQNPEFFNKMSECLKNNESPL